MNIILISIDALRRDYLGCYGNKSVKTPNVDKLAKNGVMFRNVISQASHTLPSHSSLLSGLYPFRHGLRKVEDIVSPKNPNATMVFSQLKQNGFNIISLLGMGIETFSFKMNSEWQYCNYSGFSTIENVYRAIKENHKNQFFLFIHYWDVHTPYNCYLPFGNRKELLINLAIFLKSCGLKSKWIDDILLKYWHHRVERIRDMMLTGGKFVDKVKAGYRRSVNLMDKYIGKIISYTKEFNISDETLIIFTADHGESFCEHNERQITAFYEHGSFLYDYLIKVPLIFYYPKKLPKKIIEKQVQSVDIVPTIYDIAGITPINKHNLDGESLLPLIYNQQYSKKYAYSETEKCDWVSLINEKFHLIERLSDGTDKQLYDLEFDATESENLATQKQEIVKEMDGYLDALFTGYKRHPSNETTADINQRDMEEVISRLKALGYL